MSPISMAKVFGAKKKGRKMREMVARIRARRRGIFKNYYT